MDDAVPRADAGLIADLEAADIHPLWDRYKKITPGIGLNILPSPDERRIVRRRRGGGGSPSGSQTGRGRGSDNIAEHIEYVLNKLKPME